MVNIFIYTRLFMIFTINSTSAPHPCYFMSSQFFTRLVQILTEVWLLPILKINDHLPSYHNKEYIFLALEIIV